MNLTTFSFYWCLEWYVILPDKGTCDSPKILLGFRMAELAILQYQVNNAIYLSYKITSGEHNIYLTLVILNIGTKL